ncbi:MAG TPA: RNA 2',3'-cyclic phosphodiesterase [Candidatus Limnocylindrales bacterium]
MREPRYPRQARGRGHDSFHRPEDDPPGTSRLFVAVPVENAVRAAVGELMARLAGEGASIEERASGQPRWVRVEGLHLTLRFLGATPDVRQVELAEAVAAAALDSSTFPVALSGGGAFPNPQRPRVLWLGIEEGAPQLNSLAGRLNGQLVQLGWAADERPLQAHLTLARTDGVPGADEAARRLIEAARDLRLSWTADRLVVYKSVLGHGPSRYEVVSEALFARN